MVVVFNQNAPKAEIEKIIKNIEETCNVRVNYAPGEHLTVIGLAGDTKSVDVTRLEANPYISKIMRVQEPYKKANIMFHPEPTIVDVNGQKIGGKKIALIAGPCSVESEKQIVDIAKAVKADGANFLRGGAFKPRTSPYAFQGLKYDGLELLKEARQETGLPIVTEIMNANHLPMFEDVDVIQVGARNMQNFELLRELGRTQKTILLKRGLANTIKELLMSAEYIIASGNENVILCERGIRTYESQYTRNTLDLSSVPVLKERTHLPVIIDPSHATGMAKLVKPMAMAATACGADGLMIEVHNDPTQALCDGAQSITPEAFADLVQRVKIIREVVKG